jgi:alpha-D-xyloside xylohydrolase
LFFHGDNAPWFSPLDTLGYTYEKGARATIHLHWDDRRNMLSIGNRSGTFPGMRSKNTFRIILVKPGPGTGVGSDSGFDRSVTYDGHQMKINLGKLR